MLNASKFGRGQLDIYKDTLIIEVPKNHNYKYAFRKTQKNMPKKLTFPILQTTLFTGSRQRKKNSSSIVLPTRKSGHTQWSSFHPHPFSGGIVKRNHKGGIAKLKPFRSCAFNM